MHSIVRVLIFSTLFFVVFYPSYGQEQDPEQAKQYVEVAEGMIEGSMAFDDIREVMVRAADLDTTFIKANYEAGDLHLRTIGKDLAVKYFLRVYRQDPEYKFDIEYKIGRSYQLGLEFDKAIDYYTRYKEKLKKKSSYQGKDKVSEQIVDRGIFECENGKEYVSRPGNFSIVNIGREINSEFEDYAPVLNPSEDEIVFTSRRREDNLNENVADDNKPYEDIYIAHKEGANWARATNIGVPVNTPYHGSNLALSKDGNTLFIYKDDNGGDIYFSERSENNVWTEPQPLAGVINSSYEEKSITISSDEKTLYFSSDRPGGFGGLDIYRATLDAKGNWSNVKNLGNIINTEYDEDGPFIDTVGVNLYFSSRGHKGMGGHDIFRSEYTAGTNEWSEPVNLGYPINTPDEDIYFVSSVDGIRAFYSSVREDGMGYTDIYTITIPEGLQNIESTPVAIVKDTTGVKKGVVPLKYVVSIVDAETKTPMNASTKLLGLGDNLIVPSRENGVGVYEFSITSPSAKDYRLSVEKEGYVFLNQNVKIQGATTEEKTLTRTIEMRKLAVGVSGILRNIYFDFDKWSFKNASYNELNKLERMMAQNQNIKVEISGHTDAVGTTAYNMFLSRKRAEAVKDFLSKKGIDPRRVKAVGYGEKKPLASNDDEKEGREINRRVEFLVIGQ